MWDFHLFNISHQLWVHMLVSDSNRPVWTPSAKSVFKPAFCMLLNVPQKPSEYIIRPTTHTLLYNYIFVLLTTRVKTTSSSSCYYLFEKIPIILFFYLKKVVPPAKLLKKLWCTQILYLSHTTKILVHKDKTVKSLYNI